MNLCRPQSWIWVNFFSTEKIAEINEKINNLPFLEENKDAPARNKKGETKKNCYVKVIRWDEISSIFDVAKQEAFRVTRKEFKYDVWDFNYLTTVNFNTYSPGGQYDWHGDVSGENLKFDFKMTFIINLSDEKFEGGEFSLNGGDPQVIEDLNKPGSMILFPSYTLHKVNPIITGCRKTLTIFIEGPPFR